MVDVMDAARRLDRVENELDTHLADFEEAEKAVEELREAYEQLEESPNSDDALAELRSVADKHHPSYTSEEGVISRLNSNIETLPGPAEELDGTLDTGDLATSLRKAFGEFDMLASAFTYADSSTVSTPVEEDFLNELGERIEEAPERLEKARNYLETAQTQFPDRAESQRKLNEARRERERREAERLREEFEDLDGDD